MEKTSEIAKGRWNEILPAIGIGYQFLKNKNGPCPVCGGKDRFRYDNKNGTGSFYCNSCGAGSGIKLVMNYKGVNFADACKIVDEITGRKPQFDQNSELLKNEDEENRIKAVNIWKTANKIGNDNNAVRTYLDSRLMVYYDTPAIRSKQILGKTNMVCLVQDHEGKPVNSHKTVIETGQKFISKGKIPEGSAIRLSKASEAMIVSEGIITALSASKLFSLPAWSCINANMLSKWIPPEECKTVIIAGDNDENYTGQFAAYALAKRLSGTHNVTVMIPDKINADWNDILLEKYNGKK